MAQTNPGDWPIDPNTTDGVTLADLLNRLALAVLSSNRGPSRPADATAGLLWAKSVSGGTNLMMFDGAQDVTIAQVTSGGSVAAPWTYTQTQIDNRIGAAVSDVQGSVVNTLGIGSGLLRGGTARDPVVSHGETSDQDSVNNAGGVVIQDVILDQYGHTTILRSTNLDNRYLSSNDADGRYLRSGVNQTTEARLTADTFRSSSAGTPTDVAFALGGSLNTGLYIGGGNPRMGLDGDVAAIFSAPGSGAPSAETVMTREKGDARYMASGGLVAQAAGQVAANGSWNRRVGIFGGVNRTTTGTYRVNLNSNVANVIAVATPLEVSGSGVCQIANVQSDRFDVQVRTLGGALMNSAFSVILF